MNGGGGDNGRSVRVSTLDNGLRVVSDPMATVETVSVGVWVEAGARHEHPEINGVSHLLEHMAFKGTGRRSALEIAAEIEDVGGHLNAYTSRESTAYFAKVLKEDTALAVDIIADILQDSVMDAEELERERSVIIQEINQALDTPDDVVFDHFQETAYPDQPIGRPVLGTAELVGAMERDVVIDYMGRHYGVGNMILVGAGRIEHGTLAALAADAFSGLSAGAAPATEPTRYEGGDFRENRDLEQAHVVLGFEGISYEDPDFHAASMLSTILGGGMSSRLFQEVREKRGLAYSVYSFLSCYQDGGLFGIYAGTSERETGQLIPVVADEILKVRDGVGEDELARARAQIKSSILMSLESTSARCEQLARQMMVFGRPIPVAEIVAKIEAVDAAAVVAAARRITAGKPVLAALGPIAGVEGFDSFAARVE
ncbi:MAG TPA: pitrilysin family protein [Rhodospirillales bacterium]|nr:pitrilysin family protein [Rhodospirillales bacterium]